MTTAKIEVSIGGVSFSGEGSEAWLSQQLDKIIKAAPALSEIAPAVAPPANNTASPNAAQGAPFTDSLASYIKAKGGDANQQKRFLATADWLRRKGETSLKTAAVTKALADHHQKRLANPSESLATNVKKGFCEKGAGGTFFVTPDGLKELGSD